MDLKKIMYEVYLKDKLIGTVENEGRWSFLEEYSKTNPQESFDVTDIEFKLVMR